MPPHLMKQMLEIPGATHSQIAGAPQMESLNHPDTLAEAILRNKAALGDRRKPLSAA